jgi:hypothetical protein
MWLLLLGLLSLFILLSEKRSEAAAENNWYYTTFSVIRYDGDVAAHVQIGD